MEDTARSGPLGALVGLMPFARSLEIVLESATAEEVLASMPYAADRCTAGGVLHGGALISLADTVAAVCAHLNLPEGASTATISSSTAMLRAVRSGPVRAVAKRLHAGRSTVVVSVEMRDEAGCLVAQTTQTQAILPADS